MDTDECQSSPCMNGGQCTGGVGLYTCECNDGFRGSICETEIDECASEPCANGGNCTDAIHAYSCACVPGYAGDACLSDVDECVSMPCLNGGSCQDGLQEFSCTCTKGWAGAVCGDERDLCATFQSGCVLAHGTCNRTSPGKSRQTARNNNSSNKMKQSRVENTQFDTTMKQAVVSFLAGVVY